MHRNIEVNATLPISPIDTDAPLVIERTLAMRVIEAVHEVADDQRAFEALERLVTPADATDRFDLQVDRDELGALLRVLNASMRDRLQEAAAAAQTSYQSLNDR